MNPFDFINNITSSPNNLIRDSDNPSLMEKDYPAFMVNRGLSYFVDTIMVANDMNGKPDLDAMMQYEYLHGSVRKRKRFSKWAKPDRSDDLKVVMDFYSCSRKKAEDALTILNTNQIDEMRDMLDPGGR